jgi:hypothetical protein
MYWSLVLALIMLYVSMFMPFELAFLDTSPLTESITIFIDVFFLFDIVINFFSSYEIENGREENSHKKIAINYLSGWFTLDLFATVPTDVLDKFFLLLSGDHLTDEGNS